MTQATAVKPIIDQLNKQLANFSVLYVKLHNYHWYVRGPQFFTLHAKFQELYTEFALHIDEIAERSLTLKGNPPATMKEYLELSSVQEAKGKESAEQMVQSLVADFDKVIEELKEAIESAEQLNDETTGDMLLAIQSSLEKHNWLLSSFLG
ncbi:Dps family protein [Paenibacillus turpanensis]|uniref:Dps family protein n=1 Tax=Paenibacillus turpanensis TaxID=2689078 RepID=UPI0014077F21|nr:Dps family protein [Paenibacillus turpanensis]